MKREHLTKGFTLIELMVSLSIFVLVMTVIMGAVLSVLDLNGKSITKKSAMDNLNIALESMSRNIRFGLNYHCGTAGILTDPSDCSSGDGSLSISTSTALNTLITYDLFNGSIRQKFNNAQAYPITSPEVDIQSLTFRVIGSYPYAANCPVPSVSDCLQPQVIITITGVAGNPDKAKTLSTFKVETTVSQRKLDI